MKIEQVDREAENHTALAARAKAFISALTSSGASIRARFLRPDDMT